MEVRGPGGCRNARVARRRVRLDMQNMLSYEQDLEQVQESDVKGNNRCLTLD